MAVFYTDDGVPHGDSYDVEISATIRVDVPLEGLPEEQIEDTVADIIGVNAYDIILVEHNDKSAVIKVKVYVSDLSEDQYNDLEKEEVKEAIADDLGINTTDFEIVSYDVEADVS